ncbi:MAG: RDD family protein [Vicinamibacterales bacterium]
MTTRPSSLLAAIAVALALSGAALAARQAEPSGPDAPPAVSADRETGARGARARGVRPRTSGTTAAPASGESPQPPLSLPDTPADDSQGWQRREGTVFRLGQDHPVRAGETVRDVVLISGTTQIAGRVTEDVVVVLGSVHLASTASIGGDVVVVGGSLTAESGASVHGDVVVIGGPLTAPGDFHPRGEQIVVGTEAMGDRVRAFTPWVTSGLLLGRLVVPSLPWVWGIVGIFFLVSLVLSLVFESAIRACATTIATKPFTTFLMGILVLLLVGPVCFVLAVSVVGIAVIPFLFCALLVAWILGKIAVTRWLGSSVLPESDSTSRGQAIRSFVIGFAIVTLAFMVPVLGIVTWVLIGLLGLGAATSSLFKALRRENPAPVRPPVPPPIPRVAAPVVTPSPGPSFMATSVEAAAPPAYGFSPGVPHELPYAAPAATREGEYSGGGTMASAAAAAGVDSSDPLLLPRATFWQRVAAGVLDVVLVALVFGALDIDNRPQLWFLTLLTAYHAAFWTWRGTTIGGIITHLHIVRTDGRPLSGGDAIIRGLSSVFSLLVLGLGFFWILRDPDSQAWHDKIAGTLVVRVPRSLPLR